MGRCKSPGSLKSFVSHVSQLPGASILSSSVLTLGSSCSLIAAQWQILFSFLGPPRAQKLEGWNCYWLCHPCLLIKQEILHYFISQLTQVTHKPQKNFCALRCTLKHCARDFPGGPVVKNLSSNAGDAGQGTKISHATEQVRLDTTKNKKYLKK